MRRRFILAAVAALTLSLGLVAPSVAHATPATHHSHHLTQAQRTAKTWAIARQLSRRDGIGSMKETNGNFFLGSPAGGHGGDAVVEVGSPGKTITFRTTTTFDNQPAGTLQWTSNGNYIASTTGDSFPNCSQVTTKTDLSSNGTIWVLTLDGNNNPIWSNRYCDNTLDDGNLGIYMAGHNNGTQFVECDHGTGSCNGLFRAINQPH